MDKKFDVVIIGAGAVGCAIAYEFSRRYPKKKIAILEKNELHGQETSRHNSGVIHSGIYYKPGSFKARFCKAGNESMLAFCRANNIEAHVCGMVIVATSPEELPGLERLYQRGVDNGLAVRRLDVEHKVAPFAQHPIRHLQRRSHEPALLRVRKLRVAADLGELFGRC